MRGTAENTVYRLVVTGPARDQLTEHFQRLFASHGDVLVQKDRRYRERRRRASSVLRLASRLPVFRRSGIR